MPTPVASHRGTGHRHPRRAQRAEGDDANGVVVHARHGREPASRPRAWRGARRAGCFALAALLLGAAPALAQTPPQQIDPLVPTTIPAENLHDFKGYLDQVMEEIQRTNGPTILAAGNTLWRGLAAVVVVWTGIKIAMSGTFSMWALIELVIGLWIPWIMLHFYATPITYPGGPSIGVTFPGMIAGGGNWLHSFFLSDIVTAVQTELANLVTTHTTAISDAWSGASWFELTTALGDVVSTLIIGTSMMLFIFLCLVVIYAVTYAQVIWAQMAIMILTFVGPLMIPWLVFEPMAFLFWGWFRSMITFALYGAIAGAIMRVFMSVSLGYLTTLLATANVENPVQMVTWLLILLPLMVAGVIASLKVGELAGMLVSGGGGGGAGMTGALMMAATGGKAMLAGKAAGAAGVK